MAANSYAAQVALLVRTIPEIAEEEVFALKGGTAINLFVRDLPRFSVDIDLVYLPLAEREESLAGVREGLTRIAARVRKRFGATVDEKVNKEGTALNVRSGATMIKVEVNPVLRGTLRDPELRSVSAKVQERFGYAEMNVVAFDDLYAGKIAAAVDRQHPRDLFDIRGLLANEGITDALFQTFLVYLISHNRPPDELLGPHIQDIDADYHGAFSGMTPEPVPLKELEQARQVLIKEIQKRVRLAPSSDFLRSFFALAPDWKLLGVAKDVAEFPSVRWKTRNLEKLARQQPRKFEAQAAKLDAFLKGEYFSIPQ